MTEPCPLREIHLRPGDRLVYGIPECASSETLGRIVDTLQRTDGIFVIADPTLRGLAVIRSAPEEPK